MAHFAAEQEGTSRICKHEVFGRGGQRGADEPNQRTMDGPGLRLVELGATPLQIRVDEAVNVPVEDTLHVANLVVGP